MTRTVYSWGGRFTPTLTEWEVVKETSKTLTLRREVERGCNTRRLNKSGLDVPSWEGSIYTESLEVLKKAVMDTQLLVDRNYVDAKTKINAAKDKLGMA